MIIKSIFGHTSIASRINSWQHIVVARGTRKQQSDKILAVRTPFCYVYAHYDIVSTANYLGIESDVRYGTRAIVQVHI